MNHQLPPALLIGIIAVILLLVFFSKFDMSEPEVVRRRELAALARNFRLPFDPKSDFRLAERLLFLTWLRRGGAGDVRYAYNVMRGYCFEDWLRPEKVEFNLSRLIEVRKLLPEFLFATT